MGIICERIGLGAGGQTADSLPIGSRPARFKGGFVDAGFWLLCGAADGDFCGFLCPFGFFLYRRALYCPQGMGPRPFRHRVVQSFLFGGYIFALQAEASASFSARSLFTFSFSSPIEVRLSETLLWRFG